MDRSAFFWQIQDGKLPPPRAAVTLGFSIREVSPEAGTIEVEFEGKPEFTNPAGHIQGGFLAAMLDDTMGPALAATLRAGEFAPTLNLNVSFARPARVGRLLGKGRIVRRGKDICFLAAELFQDGELVASATATAMVRRLEAESPRAVDGKTGARADRHRAPAKDGSRIFQFKVVLEEVEPPVWRSIQVPETYSFWDLHVAIQDAMGWLDYHLHEFRVKEPGREKALQIGIPDDDPFEGQEPTEPGWELPIASHFTHPGITLPYAYDFGDGWAHSVTLEAIVARQDGQKYPVCVAGARACPPEDCGGPSGYDSLLAAIRDPDDEEHESLLEWLGGRFDPERFDPSQVKFDDPRKRWKLAFAPPPPARARRGRAPRGRGRGRR